MDDEIHGSLFKAGEPYHASVVYRESRRILTYKEKDKILKEYAEPVTFYGSLLDKDGYEDFSCTCPNCGHQTMASKLGDGCPYCGTVFEIEETYPCFTSFYTVAGIVERAHLMDRLKKRMIIAAVISGILFFLLYFLTSDYVIWFRILSSLFMGAFCAGMTAFLVYMASSVLLLIRVFREAGRSLPLLKGLRTRKKLEEKMQPIDPAFSFEYFEGRIISLFRTIAFCDRRDDLSIYTGNEDLSFLNDMADMQYRGVLQLKAFHADDQYVDLEVKAFMSDIYADTRIHRKDENFILSIRKDVHSISDPSFSFIKIQCPNCSGSFDALHKKTCPHCGTPYDLVHDDWVITGIRRA